MIKLTVVLTIFFIVYMISKSLRIKSQSPVNQLNTNGGCSSGLLGAGIGLIVGGGPVGAIIGYALGTIFGSNYTREDAKFMGISPRQQDFSASLIVLSAAVMKADNSVKKSELDYVKHFFVSNFGQEHAEKYILTLREVLKQDIKVDEVSQQIGRYMDYSSRLQLIHYLFGIASADGHVHELEVDLIQTISNYMGLSRYDFESIKAMFVKQIDDAYIILGLTSSATDEEVKKAYREMAKKNHPDKVAYLGDDVRKAAEKKFQEINDAYDRIKKQRGMI